MARNLIDLLLISLLPISETSACGVIPAGQDLIRTTNKLREKPNFTDATTTHLKPFQEHQSSIKIGSTRNINVTGFLLPVSMAFSGEVTVRTQVPMISSSADAAKGFVSRLMMQAVTDVLDQQGRAALIPDAVISMILGQLTIQVTYEPLECKEVFVDKAPGDMLMAMDKPQNCIIVRNTVTAICKPANDCQTSMADKLLSIDAKHLSISGSITSTNIVMANWNRSMWQSVVSRAIRAIASDPFGSHFATAVVTVT